MDNETGVIKSNGGLDRERVAELFSENTGEVNHDMAGCTLSFSTNSGHSTTVRIEVAVLDINDNSPLFTFTGDKTRYEVRENKPANSTILIFSVSDPDKGANGSVVDVQMSGADKGIFYLIEELVEVGENRFLRVTLLTNSTHTAIDFETNEQFNITFTARDQGTPTRRNSIMVTLDIQDENEGAPQFGMTSYDVTINETTPVGQVIVQVSATDMDGGEFGIVQYTLLANDDITRLYAVNSMTGEIYLRQSVENLAANTVHEFLIQSYNGNFTIPGNMANIRITIVRARVLPQFKDDHDVVITSYNDTIIEGNNLTTPTWQVDNLMQNFNFTIKFDGVAPEYDLSSRQILVISVYHVGITFINVDRETTPVINGLLIATDAEHPAVTSSLHFCITVLDINDNPPVFISTNFSVSENQPVGYKVGDILTYDRDEGDNRVVEYQLLWSSQDGTLDVQTNGSIIVRNVIDFEQIESIQLLVMASDQGSPSMTTNQNITVSIENVNEYTPMFVTKNLTYTVFLDTTSLPLTLTINATDDDAGLLGEVTYSQGTEPSNASSFVSINQQSGDITINSSVLSSAASAYPYLFPIVVTDEGGLSSTVTFTVYVWTDFCEQNPCANDAVCTNVNNDYVCQCADDTYGGRNCSIIKFPCNSSIMPQPCLNDGHCTNINDDLDYVCRCVNSFSGRNCQYSAISFTPRSYLTYTGIPPSLDNLNVTLQISPKSLNGLIFYAIDAENFVTLELKGGEVIARTARSTGDGDVVIATNNSWYQIDLTITEQVHIWII